MVIMKKDVVISNKARASIREIFEYVKEREKSVQKAHYVKKAILDKCLRLKDFSGYSIEPYLAEYPENYRSVSIWDYIIIYLVDEKRVRVLNVLHGKRHPDAREDI